MVLQQGLSSTHDEQHPTLHSILGTFRSDYDYEYKYDFWAREAWVLAAVDTVVAVVSSQQKYFSNFCEYEVNILSVAGMFSRQTAQDATKSAKHCETSCTEYFTVYPCL